MMPFEEFEGADLKPKFIARSLRMRLESPVAAAYFTGS